MAITDDIKAKTDIVEFVSEYDVDLKKAGRCFRSGCPFCSETGTFHVFPERQTWRCFGRCNTGGDVIAFAIRAEDLDFAGALKFLAERAGISLPQGA